MSQVHLHRDDYPDTLAALAEVLGAGRRDPDGLAAIGYQPGEHGVWVDWDQLIDHSWLSSTERAAVIVVRGIAAAERQGGWPPGIARALTNAIGAL